MSNRYDAGDNSESGRVVTLTFKDKTVEEEWNSGKLARFCRLIVMDGALFARELLNWEWLLTDVYRTPEEDAELKGTGMHPAWRAVDVRTRDRKQKDVDRVVAYLNGKYSYDPKRPAKPIAYAKEHGNGPHCHIQTHQNSTFRSFPKEGG